MAISIQLKRDVQSVVDKTTLLPGELAVATDTGKLYSGKGDGTKAELVISDEIQDLVVATDDAIADPSEVPPGTIGPVKLRADKISFTDGTTFQQKYEAGAFVGPVGPTGPQGDPGPKGDTGVAGKNGADAKEIYDHIIRTQAEFDALVASPTWLDAKSVAFVGDGGTLRFTHSGGINVPLTVKTITGVNNPIFEVDGLAGLGTSQRAALYYDVDLIDVSSGTPVLKTEEAAKGRSIEGITVDCHKCTGGNNINCFASFSNVINCTAIANHEENTETSVCAFTSCYNLINCQATTTSYGETRTSYAFMHCINLTNCKGNAGTTTSSVSDMAAYKICTNLVNCEASQINSLGIGQGKSVGFSSCNQLSNCVGFNLVTVFDFCNYLANCKGNAGVVSRTTTAFSSCNQLTNCIGSAKVSIPTLANNAVFRNCSYLNGCKRDGTDGTFLAGTNTNVDTITVLAS